MAIGSTRSSSPLANASWGKLAAEFLQAKHDPAMLQPFVNTVLAQGWRAAEFDIDESDLRSPRRAVRARRHPARGPGADGGLGPSGRPNRDDALRLELVTGSAWSSITPCTGVRPTRIGSDSMRVVNGVLVGVVTSVPAGGVISGQVVVRSWFRNRGRVVLLWITLVEPQCAGIAEPGRRGRAPSPGSRAVSTRLVHPCSLVRCSPSPPIPVATNLRKPRSRDSAGVRSVAIIAAARAKIG